MIIPVLVQEVKRHLKSPMPVIFTFFFFLMTFFFVKNTDPGTVILVVQLTREWHNAPLIIAKIFSVWGGLGLLITMVMAGKAVVRDFQHQSQDFFFTAPVTKTAYLLGRFGGSLAANLLIYAGVILGFLLGCLALDAGHYGPFSLQGFVRPLVGIVLPNLFIAGSLFFALATQTRKMVMTYVVGITFLLLSMSVTGLLSQGDNLMLRALADPFGYAALSVSTLQWTVAEINARPMPFTQYLLLNRLLWMGLGAAALAMTWIRFKMHTALDAKRSDSKPSKEMISPPKPISMETVTIHPPSAMQRFRQLAHWTGRELWRIVKHPAYLILAGMGVANVYSNFALNVDMAGSRVQPLTSWFLAHTQIAWGYMIPLVILFGGMIVWRERDDRVHPLYDVLPLPDWMAMASKFLVLGGMQFIYLLAVLLTGALSQLLIFRFTDVQLPLYLQTLFGIEWVSYLHMAVVVVFIQNLASNKTVGFFLTTIYFVLDLVIFNMLGFDQVFLRYGHVPGYIYSSINGFGHFTATILWYSLLWGLGAVVLLGFTALLWRRDEETSLRIRWRLAQHRASRRTRLFLGGMGTAFIAVLAVIVVNKFVVNRYFSRDMLRGYRAAYEKTYAPLAALKQPRLEDVKLNVAFYPASRACRIQGEYRFENKGDQPIDSVLVNLSNRRITRLHRLDFSQDADIVQQSSTLGVRIYRLNAPLEPGSEIMLRFDYAVETPGFTDNNPKNELAANGSSLVLSTYGWADYFPVIGYNPAMELTTKVLRQKYGLPSKASWLTLEQAQQVYYGMGDTYVGYEAEISTSADQHIVANGDRLDERVEGGRRICRFVSETPMRPEFNFTSQRFAVQTTERNGKQVEVYYNPKHFYNVQRILNGTADALAYGEAHFTPYPYNAIRVQENNEYMDFGGARAMPGLVQWRESAGFLSRLDSSEIDMVYFIAAHEMAHQWWGVTLMPEALEGAVLATEMIAQYTATRCFENRFGPEMTRKLLRQDMRDYLNGRQGDLDGERPMLRTYFNYYMTYAKSNVIMYALTEYIGEERINAALKDLLDRFEYRERGMVQSLDVVEALREVTPDSLQYLITDFFETITLWGNRVVSAGADPLPGGRYRIHLQLASHKFRADSEGTQTEIAIGDWIPVMVFGEGGKVLFKDRVHFTENQKTLDFDVAEKPVQAGLDPYVLLIDRDRGDNRKVVTIH